MLSLIQNGIGMRKFETSALRRGETISRLDFLHIRREGHRLLTSEYIDAKNTEEN